MKVINICRDDYANFSYDNAMALKSVGIDAESYKINTHIFDYDIESKRLLTSDINSITSKCDIVQVMHSDHSLIKYLSKKPKIVVWHTGTRYRQNPIEMNEYFNPIVDMSFVALGEFWDRGARNQHFCIGAVDMDKFKFHRKYYKGGRPTIGHYPSNPEVKGTSNIIKIMGLLKKRKDFKFNYSIERVAYADQLERLSECDIYIELFNLEQNGKPYGSWGITALEAAAMGKIVITNHQFERVYEQHYGECALMTANTESELFNQINRVLDDSIITAQINTEQWVKDNHSYEATGKRLKQIFENEL